MKFKKLTSLFVTMALAAGVCSLPAMAEETAAAETGCLNVLSDTVYTFDGEEIGTYGVVSNSVVNNSAPAEDDAAKFAGNSAEIVPEEDGSENKVLKLTQANGSYGVQIQPWKDASVPRSNYHIAFDFNKSGGDQGYFGLAGFKGSRIVMALFMYGKTLYINNTAVYTYELDTWYNLDLKLTLDYDGNINTSEEHYAQLSIKKRGESEPTVIDLPFGTTYTQGNDLKNDRTALDYFYLGWTGGKATGGSVMIDNYMQKELEAPIAPSMDSHDDSFDSLPPINPNTSGSWNQTTVATRTGWTFVKQDAGTYVTTEIEDGKLKLSTTDGSKFPEIVKQPFYSAPNVRHRISLKMSGYDSSKETERSVMLRFANADTSNNAGSAYLMRNFIHFDEGYLKFYGMGGAADRIRLIPDPDFMYPIEFVYDAGAKVCVATVTDRYGVQHEVNLKEKIQSFMDTLRDDDTTDGIWYNLNAVGIYFPSGSGNAVCYLDDFNWDILDPVTVAASASIASGSEGEASLDETVIINYGRPVSYKKSCEGENTATVSVTLDGQTVDVPYTLSTLSGKLFVNLKGLKPHKSYTVTVSDVTLMEDDISPESVSTTFTTWETSVGVSNIQLIDADTNVSADIISGYADGTNVTLAAKQYTGGVLGETKTGYVLAKRGFAETIELHTPFAQAADSTEVFVWSDFISMIPYVEKTVLGTPLSEAAPTVSGTDIIESISVDDAADTLTITGTLPQNVENWVSVEVLQPNLFWTAADAQAEADRTGSAIGTSLEEYTEDGTDDIGNYLAYFGQIDNKAGQPYSIVVNNYTQSDASTLEFRLRLGDGNYFYYSSRILDLLNAAASGSEMETVLEGFAYLADETAAERAYLAIDEEAPFYENLLAYRNSLTGSKFSELFEIIDIADDIVRLTKLKLAENEADLSELLTLCNDYGLDDYNSYDLYRGVNDFKVSEGACLNAAQKANLISHLLSKKNTYATVEAFTADFNAQAVLYAASGADSKNLVLHLLKNADILVGKLGTFASCTAAKQLSVCDTINKKSVFASIDALGSEVTTLSASPESNGQQGGELEIGGGTGSAGSVSGGNNGGGGGGGGSKDNSTVTDKNNETDTESSEADGQTTFTDLTEVSWAQEAIYALREKGIVSGRSARSFDPLAPVTREEFAKMLVLAIGCYDGSATADFSDVSTSDWAYSYIASAAKKGLINGIGDGKFGTGGIISRQDMAVLIARAAGFEEGNNESGFADDASISDYARAAVGYVRAQGLMNGVGDNSFAPLMDVSRAQAAKVIYELIQRG